MIGQGAQPQPTVPSRTPPSRQRKHLTGPTHVPWPHVEAASPVPSSPTGTASIIIPDAGADQSVAATYDGASEQSGITAMMPR